MEHERQRYLASIEELNVFRNPQDTLVYARYKNNPAEPYYLREGTAGKLREWVEENLECPINGCQNRAITTFMKNGEKRDSFKHLNNMKEHDSKEIFTFQGRALINKWVKEHQPTVKINNEDGTVLTWITGEKLAIEIQYDPITFVGWEAKHNKYIELGIPCLWFFGHIPLHFPDWIPQLKQVSLLPLQRQILITGTRILWLNPISEQVGLILSEVNLHACLIAECKGKDPECMRSFTIEHTGKENNSYISIQPLNNAKLKPNGISLAKLQHLEKESLTLENIKTVEGVRAGAKKIKVAESFSEEQKIRDQKIQELIRTSQLEKNRPINSKLVKNNKPSRTGYSCSVCGDPLSEVYKEEGKHGLC